MRFKITAGQPEYFRYSGASAEVERRGLGSSRPELAWAGRQERRESNKASVDVAHPNEGSDSSKPPDLVAD
jgi:hypothetical protein